MSNQQNVISPLKPPVIRESSINVKALFKKYLFHWPLFIIGVALAILAAYYYIQSTSPVYPILATLKFNAPTATSTGISNIPNPLLQSLDPTSKPVIVENEIEVIQSKKIMYQVVNNLQLWTTYTMKHGLITKDLYKSSPVKFNLIKQTGTIDQDGVVFKILINDRQSFKILKENDEDGPNKNFSFSSPFKSSFGTWQLMATPEIGNFKDSTITMTVQNPDIVADVELKSLKAELQDKTAPFVNLTFSDEVPERGKDVLNAVLDLYQKNAVSEKNAESQKALNFINLRFDTVHSQLDVIDKQLAKYKSSQGITDIAAQAQGLQQLKIENSKSVNDIDNQLASLKAFDNYFNANDNNQNVPPVSNINDASLTNMYDQLVALQLKHEQMANTLPPKNPIFVNLNNQIKILKSDFKNNIEAHKSALLATKAQVQSNDSHFQTSIQNIPLQDKEYNAIKRDQSTKEALYQNLSNLREQLSLRYSSAVSDSEIVDDAHATKAKWPKPLIIYVFALILGLAAPAGLLYARESLQEFIISKQQILDETGVPVLGELSYQDSTTPIVVTEGRGKFAIGEQFRVLRTNLYHLHGGNESGRVTLFTSSVGGEGKSFVTSNLAVTLAFASRKTIILEMDLRKPKICENFKLSSEHPGISEYLAEETSDISALIQHTHVKGLDVISCGSIHPNPSELLEKSTLDKLIVELKKIYDDILIDSPPIHLVTDSKIIARVANASLYLVMQGYTNKAELEFISEINTSRWFPKFTVVFNGIRGEKFGYGYNTSNSYYSSYNLNKEKDSFRTKFKRFLSRF